MSREVYKAVIDTNILVSALLSTSAESAVTIVVNKIFTTELLPVYSSAIMSEYEQVLHRAKFKFPLEKIERLLEMIRFCGIEVHAQVSKIKLPDEDDRCFYDAAKTEGVDYLVTGNKRHFPDENFIVTAAEYLKAISWGK